MFIRFESDQHVSTTIEITQYSTHFGCSDNINSPRDSMYVTIWRNSDNCEDFILIDRKEYRENFSKVGAETCGPWLAYYAMNNDGKTMDRFRIPDNWRSDLGDDNVDD